MATRNSFLLSIGWIVAFGAIAEAEEQPQHFSWSPSVVFAGIANDNPYLSHPGFNLDP